MPIAIAPTNSGERIQSLDFLRGFAVLGILFMNIQSYSMPGAAYLNPFAYGSLDGINWWVWLLSHIFTDQKFMSIFSMLFGAGVVLVTQRAGEKGVSQAGLHYRRTFWLLVIGLIHAHLIWYGDILVIYALCALFVYLFRKVRPVRTLIVGLLLIAVHSIFSLFGGFTFEYWPQESRAEIAALWQPNDEEIQEEIAAVTGSLSEQISHNSAAALEMETGTFFYLFLWRAGGLMLVGMALYKWGVFSAGRSRRFYFRGLILSFLLGFPLIIFGVVHNNAAGWSYEYSMLIGSQYNYWGSLFVSFGYICLVMLISLSGSFSRLRTRLAAVGRMALTNYIAQSLICVLLFYGIGLGLFGQVERIWQLVIVLVILLLQIAWSRPWLKRYRFGPLEWLWRSLTYWKKQPFRRA